MRSWRDLNPGFEYRAFDDKAAAEYIAEMHGADVRSAFVRAVEPAQRADIFRLAYLAVEGGFYADADDACLAPLGTFVPITAMMVTAQEDYGTLCNNFIGVTRRHPIISLALQLGVEGVNRGDHDMVWLGTGPGLLSRAFAQTLSRSDQDMDKLIAQTVIFRLRPLQQFVGFACPLGYKRARQRSSLKVVAGGSRPTSNVHSPAAI
jgi:mannosyltransferase OCH1-like enzyme